MGRDPLYIGALEEVSPDDLHKYEDGSWVAMPKVDGMWSRLHVKRPDAPNEVYSRAGLLQSGEGVNGLLGIAIPQVGATLVGELMSATEWATKEYERLGYRQIWLFDAASDPEGKRLYWSMTWWERYQLIVEWSKTWSEDVRKRLPIVEAWEKNFQQLFDREVALGREGIMLWKKHFKLDAKRRSDGKVPHMLKCKKMVDKSYLLIGFARTKKGNSLTGRWGLYDKSGKLVDVLQAGAPGFVDEEKSKHLIGKVADFVGFEVFKSGSLRSAQFLKWREDVSPKDCMIP